MDTSINAVIVNFNIHIEPLLDGSGRERYLSVQADLETPYGDPIGRVETDIYDFAPNLPSALFRAYKLHQQIAKGKITPSVNF